MGRHSTITLVLLACTGCYAGRQGDADSVMGADDPSDDGASGESGEGEGDDGDDDGAPGSGDCAAEAPAVALRYLTRLEYENTIRDLFGEPMEVTGAFAPDQSAGGYFANSVLAPSSTQLEMFLDTAQTLAERAVTDKLGRFVDCEPTEDGCAELFVRELGRRAFRRPLSEDEVAAYLSDYDTIASEQGAVLGLQVAAAAMLASPHFLYIGERTEAADPDARAYDLASRLSYFLWASMPDEALLDAAADGTLATEQGVEEQARRMLDDPRAIALLESFATQWLQVDALAETAPKHPEQFPAWSSALADAAELETSRLVEHVVRDGDARFATLLQSREAWVDPSLAALYGVAAPGGEAGWVELPAGERAGLLTRAAFLARHAHATEVSWVHRGKVVRERLLCGELPPPPPVADDSPINDDSRLQDPACAGCHTLMDPIGVGFDRYDAIGAFVDGDAAGNVAGIADGDFDGAIELSERLAQSPEGQACFAVQLYRYANRRAVEAGDQCAVAGLTEHFAQTDGDIRELIVALATADTFRGTGDD